MNMALCLGNYSILSDAGMRFSLHNDAFNVGRTMG